MSLKARYMSMAAKGAGGDVITLSGQNILAFAFTANANAELFINTDGTVDERINFGAAVQIDVVTNWVIPNGSAPGLYEARYLNLTGDTLTFATAAVNVYSALTSLYAFRNEDTTPDDFLVTDSTFDVQIRLGTGSVLDTGSYRLLADREDF